MTATGYSSGGLVNGFNVLSNDEYRGTRSSTSIVPATCPGNVIFDPLTPPINDLPYYSINTATGAIVVGNLVMMTAGFHIMQYRICDAIYPSICGTAFVRISVPNYRSSNNSKIFEIFEIDKTYIAPNPSNGDFTIFFNSEVDTANIELYNIIGQKVYDGAFEKTDEIKITTEGIATGTYLLKINQNDSSIVRRIIIK